MGQERAFDGTGERTSPRRGRDERVASTSERPHGPLCTVISRTGLLLASTLIGLMILEYGVRVFLPRYVPCEAVVFHMEGGVPLGPKNHVGRHTNNTSDYDVTVRINAYGFRDAKDLKDSRQEDFFVVGDSFGFGWGVEEEDRYSNLLASMFGTDVYNISVPTDIEGYEKLVRHARTQGATIANLIVGVCMENDLRDYRVRASDNAPAGEGRKFLSVKSWLTRRSAAYNAIKNTVHESGPLKRVALKLRLITRPVDRAARQSYSRALVESSVDRLTEMVADCGTARIVVVVIPSRRLWMGDDREMYSRIHNEFVALAQDRGLTVVDLRAALEEGGDPLRYHFQYDGHWNKRGHRKAAEEIAEALRPL